MYCLFCVVLCIVCVYTCTELLPPGGYPIAVKYIISICFDTKVLSQEFNNNNGSNPTRILGTSRPHFHHDN